MSYTSIAFFLFLGIVAVLYFVVPKNRRWIILLAASYAFYGAVSLKLMLFLLFTTITTFLSAHHIKRAEASPDDLAPDERKTQQIRIKHRKRRRLALCLVVNIGILVFFKYANFAVSSLSALFGLSVGGLNLIVPLGISFYTFQSAGYVIDVYRGKVAPDTNLAKYALFVSFFPQIVQGPIGRYDALAPQLYAGHDWDAIRAKDAIQIMLWGLFKKLIIADRAAVLVNQVFSDYTAYSGAIMFVAVLCYSVMIYCDFSGGIDISIGAAKLLGIELEPNFRRPFFADSVADFWRRWHITLGSWLRDYLFYPISLSKPMGRFSRLCRKRFGNDVGKLIPACTATFIVYLVVGAWHGAGWKYTAFGLYNSVIITSSLFLEALYSRWRGRFTFTDGKTYHVFRVLRTLLLVCLGRYFTRAGSFRAALSMLKTTFTSFGVRSLTDGTLLRLGLTGVDFIILGASLVVLFAADGATERGVDIKSRLDRKPFALQWFVILAALCAIVFLGIYAGGYIDTEFIYAQF